MIEFTLASYASIFFFVVGLRLALFQEINLNFLKLILIFVAIAIPLSLIFMRVSVQNRLIVSVVWTSLIWIGFHFGKKIQ